MGTREPVRGTLKQIIIRRNERGHRGERGNRKENTSTLFGKRTRETPGGQMAWEVLLQWKAGALFSDEQTRSEKEE